MSLFPSRDESGPNSLENIPAEERQVLEKVAKKVVRHGFAIPAIMTLETVKPLNFIGSQAMIFFQPIVQSIFVLQDYDTFRQAMERRENVENLLLLIEEYDAISQKREKLINKKIKAQKKNWTWYQRWLGIRQPRIEISPEEMEEIERQVKVDQSSDRARDK